MPTQSPVEETGWDLSIAIANGEEIYNKLMRFAEAIRAETKDAPQHEVEK